MGFQQHILGAVDSDGIRHNDRRKDNYKKTSRGLTKGRKLEGQAWCRIQLLLSSTVRGTSSKTTLCANMDKGEVPSLVSVPGMLRYFCLTIES